MEMKRIWKIVFDDLGQTKIHKGLILEEDADFILLETNQKKHRLSKKHIVAMMELDEVFEE